MNRAVRLVHPVHQLVTRVIGRARLTSLRRRIQLAALVRGATIELDIAGGVTVGRRVQVTFVPGSANRLVVATRTQLGDDLQINLRGGEMTVGPGAELRRGMTCNVSGRLEIGTDVLLSSQVKIHCHEEVVIGDLVVIAERVTVADSNHVRRSPDVPIRHSVEARPVRIGENVWVGANAVITAGVRIGELAVIGANAVVTRDVRPGWLAAGNPATELRRLDPVGAD